MQPSFIATGTKLTEKYWKFCMVCQKLNVNQMRRGHANLLCIVPILSDVPEASFGKKKKM